ncbi:hypothetical protein ABNQ39_20710 [Azospirillum sp. A26]|uniref:hypothetical protein n=1 Tax=Azospirillum sp. A26 TaxID=3160607 RepID=UPI00366EC29A
MADQIVTETVGAKQVHTPGPWAIERNGRDGDEIMIVSETAKDEEGDRIPVADLFRGGYDYSDIGFSLEANARLIAAAPEAVDALKALDAVFDFDTDEDATDALAAQLGIADKTALVAAMWAVRTVLAKAEGRSNG